MLRDMPSDMMPMFIGAALGIADIAMEVLEAKAINRDISRSQMNSTEITLNHWLGNWIGSPSHCLSKRFQVATVNYRMYWRLP
jgi:hypothetical protein